MEKVKVQNKREAILKATLLMVNNHGFHAAPMSMISKQAGVSPGTIYLYFENKESLINTLYCELKTRFAERIFKGFITDMPVKVGFKVIWMNVLDYKCNEPEEALFIEQCDNTPMISEESKQIGFRAIQPLYDLWERGQQEGLIKPLSRIMLFSFSLLPILYIVKENLKKEIRLSETEIENAFKASWDAISQ
jgi:AcrR family transcriptional regulator